MRMSCAAFSTWCRIRGLCPTEKTRKTGAPIICAISRGGWLLRPISKRRRSVPTNASFDYAVLRVVPRVERQEFVNIGVIVFCLEHRFLEAKVQVHEARLRALWPALDVDMVRRHAESVVKICAGDATAGPIASLSLRERFH